MCVCAFFGGFVIVQKKRKREKRARTQSFLKRCILSGHENTRQRVKLFFSLTHVDAVPDINNGCITPSSAAAASTRQRQSYVSFAAVPNTSGTA